MYRPASATPERARNPSAGSRASLSAKPKHESTLSPLDTRKIRRAGRRSVRPTSGNTALAVFLLSALTGGVFGLAAMLPYSAVFWLSLAAGFVVQGNFANLTAGLLAAAAPRHQGVTAAVYSCGGLAAAFLGTLVFGITLDQFGGAARLAAWISSFATGGLVCLAGAVAMAFLRRGAGRPTFGDNLSRDEPR